MQGGKKRSRPFVAKFKPVGEKFQRHRALTVGRQKTRLRGSRHTNPRYPTRPKDIHLENLERTRGASVRSRPSVRESILCIAIER